MRDRWSGETVCILASGPSLTAADAAYAREHAKRCIVINNTWKLCPAADLLYAADCRWWRSENAPTTDEFAGERWTTPTAWDKSSAQLLASMHKVETINGNAVALEPPIYRGMNSSFQAMGLAVWFGAKRIVFVGLDLSNVDGAHWHGAHSGGLSNPGASTLAQFAKAFTEAAPALDKLGVSVVNSSVRTALNAFPRVPLREALP